MAIKKEVFHLYPEIEKQYCSSQAWKVGDTIYIGGAAAVNGDGEVVGVGNMETQVREAYANLKKTLAHFGATFDNIVEQWFLLIDLEKAPAVISVLQEVFAGKEYPPAIGMEVNKLGHPDLLIEIKVTARV